MPLHKQGKTKARKRSAQMSGLGGEEPPEDRWRCPPLDECERLPADYTPLPSDSSGEDNRVVVQVYLSLETGMMVRFSFIQQTCDRGQWKDVVEIDTVHDDNAHLHQYCRSTNQRNRNDPEVISEIQAVKDVQRSYNLAYDRVFDAWQDNLWRWQVA